MGCGNKINDTCGGKKVNARCVKYDGEVSDHGELNQCDCNTVEDVLEDINTSIDDIYDHLIVNGLADSCIDYDLNDDQTVDIDKAIIAMDEKICQLVDKTGLDDVACPTCVDPCDDGCNCSGGLVYFNYGQGEFFVNGSGYNNYVMPLVSGYDVLSYSVQKAGNYKITLDIGCQDEDEATGRCYVGMSINNQTPTSTPFNSQELIPYFNSKTVHFLLMNAQPTDNIKIKFKNNSTDSIRIDGIHILIEKV